MVTQRGGQGASNFKKGWIANVEMRKGERERKRARSLDLSQCAQPNLDVRAHTWLARDLKPTAEVLHDLMDDG